MITASIWLFAHTNSDLCHHSAQLDLGDRTGQTVPRTGSPNPACVGLRVVLLTFPFEFREGRHWDKFAGMVWGLNLTHVLGIAMATMAIALYSRRSRSG